MNHLLTLSILILFLAAPALAQERPTPPDAEAHRSVAVPPGHEARELREVQPEPRPERYRLDPESGLPVLTDEALAEVERRTRARREALRAELDRLPRPERVRQPAPPPTLQRSGGPLFTVDNAYDEPDDNPGDGLCATTFNDCTLRAAIDEANASPGTAPTAIEFDISFGPSGSFDVSTGAWTIRPNFDSGSGAFGILPAILRPNVWIDGETQSGASCGDLVDGVPHDLNVVLDGTLVPSGLFHDGISFFAGNAGNVVRGLVIQGFPSRGLQLAGTDNLAECLYVGTDATGESTAPNTTGLLITDGTLQNSLVSGNDADGIIVGSGSGVTVSRNLVGTDDDGLQRLGNGFGGLFVFGDDAVIDGNVVSGNAYSGIQLTESIGNFAERTVVTNNTVGLSRLRTDLGLGNNIPGGINTGILVYEGASDNDIGLPGAGNYVGAQESRGIQVSGTGTDNNRVRGNTVGLDASGEAAPNAYGIAVGEHYLGLGAPAGTIVGGSEPGEGNVASGNGLGIWPINETAAAHSLIEGNVVGLDATGNAARGNTGRGILVQNCENTTIRDNTVSGNDANGIELSGVSISISGNYVGLSATGQSLGLGNGTNGIAVGIFGDASDNDIGVPDEAPNWIGDNGSDGIVITGSGTSDNRVRNNHVGIDASGNAAPNGSDGIALFGSTSTTIRGNTVSSNTSDGIFLNGAGGTVIEDNRVGTDETGTLDLGNGTYGIFCLDATDTRIGGVGAGNTIAFNGTSFADGVFLAPDCTGAVALNNEAFENAGLGINWCPNSPCDDVTPNDSPDADGITNYPVNLSVENDGTDATITLTLDALPSTLYRVEYFWSDAPDPSGHGEGRYYRTARNVLTNASGTRTDTFTKPASLFPVGKWVAATATPDDGGSPPGYGPTSEFSEAVQVEDTSGPDYDLTATNTSPLTVSPGGSVSFDYSIINNTASDVSGNLWFTAERGGSTVAEGVIRSGTLPGGATITGGYTQGVPSGAPTGTYTYRLRIGQFPSSVVDEEVFTVEVTGSARPGGEAAWSLTEVTPWTEAASGDPEAASRGEALPTEVALSGAYPNPFSRSATVAFALPEAQRVTLAVYDVLGREVARLVDSEVEAGRHEALLDGPGLPSGVYLVRLVTENRTQTQRITLVR